MKTFSPNRQHGRIGAYREGCRCEPCKTVGKESNAKRKRRSTGQPTINVQPMKDNLPKVFLHDHRGPLVEWEKTGIPIFFADRICIKYGHHPWNIFGDEWYRDLWEQGETNAI
jgi:hypothetical protein